MRKKLLNLCMTALLSVVSTAAWALSEVNGVYQIGTAEDLVAFAELVNGEDPYACAVLTADIVKPATDVSMIGRDGQDFQGTFDGQGHTITIDLYSQGENGTALFRNVGVHAIIQNLKVQGTITTDKKFAGGIAVYSSGIIRGCYVDVNVVSAMAGDATHGGIVADAYRGTLIENCLAKFTINGATTQNCGGLVGWCENPVNLVNNLVISDGSNFDISNGGSANIARNNGNVRVPDLTSYNADPYANRPAGANYNNYVTNQWGNNNAATVVSYDNLADGRICYQLNNDQSRIGWVQRIGTDPFPVPAAFGSGQVYASGTTSCDGKSEANLTFSNSGTVQATAHQFDKYGFCPVCGCFNFHAFEFDDVTKFDPTDRTVLLNSEDDIFICEGWNRVGDGFKLNMKMANDIECIAPDGELIFNASNWVDGNFNGDGHELTIGMADAGENSSFIPKMTGIFENVIMHGSISSVNKFAASVTSHTYSDKVIIRNVFSDIDINCSLAGDNTSAGIIAVSESKTHVENVIYAGNINGTGNTECLAGFCGWASGQTYLTNCAFIGTLNDAIGDSKNISRNPGNVSSENVYCIEDYGFGDNDKFILFEDGEEGVKNGQLAYFLNGKQGGIERFYQKIGEDECPLPIKKEGALVYTSAASYLCDGTPVGATVYTNTPSGEVVLPPHKYEDGFCTVCNGLQEDFMTPVDGWFEISNGAELLWWSHYASKHLDASAKLTDDIDMGGYSERWASVGTEAVPFYGCFDGQFHVISNLNVDMPEGNGVGLIGVMNSLPSKGFGGISDADARAAEGVYIKDVVLDESCSLRGRGYIGLVGMTAPWAGHVIIKGVMMCGDVTANGGPNASGVFGCVMSSACHVTIDNCGMVGNVYGEKENGSFSGWLGSYAEVTNCFAVGEVTGIQDDDHYFARYNSATFTNCYARYGTQVPTVSEKDFASGALAWRANGSQFRTPYWYQNLDEDAYPFPDPSHGTVVRVGEQYMTVSEETFPDVILAFNELYSEKVSDDVIAYTGVIDTMKEKIDALDKIKDILELADAIDSLDVYEKVVSASVKVYQEYIAKCEEIKTYLEDHPDVEGPGRDNLEEYLENDYLEIKETHELPDSLVEKEIVHVDELFTLAIVNYSPGSDVSKLIPNYDFSQKKDNWTNGWCTSYGEVKDEKGNTVRGVEGWNVTGDMYQTIESMKPGYYLVGINGAFRPSNNRYSTNYAAGIYANGVFNYFPTVIEDYIAAADTVDQVNCNLHGAGAHDLAIYDDGFSTEGEDGILGYAVHGETGMAIAAMTNRYQAYTIANVGEDGKLTIGIKNPGTKYDRDWTGWGALKVIYCGDDAEKSGEALDQVLENMSARAQTILAYEFNEGWDDDAPLAAAPNFPEELRGELEAAVAQIESAETVADKADVAAAISDIFQKIYEGKQAYVRLYNTSNALSVIVNHNLPLVEKDAETGEWIETGDFLFSDDETEAFYTLNADLLDAYISGTYSTEQALNPEGMNNPVIKEAFPAQDEEGFYLISTPKQFVVFCAIANDVDKYAKGKLMNDVDMTGIAMEPIGNSANIYAGVLDGQGFTLSNVYISWGERCALFYELQNATVKNLKLTGEYYSSNKYMAGLTGYTSQKTTIENCEIAVVMHSGVDGDGTHGGIIGVNHSSGADVVVNNCLVNCSILCDEGIMTTSCGGVCGWSDANFNIKNTLILSDYTVSGSGSNTVCRHDGYCTVTNVYYLNIIQGDNTSSGTMGTKVTAEQLASGEICWKLNGEMVEDAHWFQTLEKDATPHLFGGSLVWKNGNEYLNSRPNIQLNAFASNLSSATNANQVVVAYTLNAEAKSGAINFYAGDELKYSHVLKGGDLYAGGHEIAIDNSLLGVAAGTKMTYELDVTALGVTAPTKIGESYKVWGPYGLAINNNPASKGFGQILMAESYPEKIKNTYISYEKPGALYAFDVNFQPINSADGTPGFYGGLPIKGETPLAIAGNYKFDLRDIRFTEDGRLFVARASGTDNSSVYEINPEDLDEPWKPVFKGGTLDEATGITYVGDEEQNRMALGLAFEGKGADLKMYVLGGKRSDGGNNTTDYNCSIYNLGTATEWTGVPSANYEPLNGVYTYSSTDVGIHEDRQGGLWFIQNRNTEVNPALKHFDATGKEDYSNLTSTNSGKIAISADGQYIAIPQGSGKIVLYENNYVLLATGKIFLTPVMTINVDETRITALAFDYANNLYVASAGSETFSRYAIPSWNGNKTVTPAPEGFTVGTESGDPDAIKSVDGNSIANGTIYNIAGQRVSKAQKGIYIVDGKKVSVK
ncbi:MAG: hypothetical protein J6W52_04535 [Bacteroidaceae bacterium]|nr:hypothetical protein [Bacteroidaceae bacterium]